MFPMFTRMKMLRSWGGIVDVTPDRSPILSKTPVPGLYVNCGWGTGGFKATPGSGACLRAWTIANDEPHPINAPVHARAVQPAG
jgi:sarcosine oxidase subunit beta